MSDREYWMPSSEPDPLSEGALRSAIFEEGARALRVHEENTAGQTDRVVIRLAGLHRVLSGIAVTLVVVAVLLTAIAVRLWFF